MTINYSIVLPTYNCNFIERSIDSIIKQTHKNWELIVIDNFSKNNVRKIIESKNDKRIRYFRYKNKGIIAKSRNLGIKNAKFKWIAFLDSDDYWTSEKLSLVSKYIKKTDFDFFYHNMFIKRDVNYLLKKKLYKYNRPLKEPVFDDLIVNGNSIIQSSVVVKKKLIKRAGYLSERKNLVAWEDFDLWLKISKITERFYLIKNTMGYYYIPQNENNKLKRFIKNIAQFKKVYKNEIKKIKLKNKINSIWWINYTEALMYYKNKNFNKSYFKIKNISTNSIKMNLNINLFKFSYYLKKIFNEKKK